MRRKMSSTGGAHGRVLLSVTGLITGLTATRATVDERVALCEVVDEVKGLVRGEKGYRSQRLQEDLLQY